MSKYTAEAVKEAAFAANAVWLNHHACGACGTMVGYLLRDEEVYFQSGCGCSWSPPRPSSWADIASWLAMQSDDAQRDQILSGLRSPAPSDGDPK